MTAIVSPNASRARTPCQPPTTTTATAKTMTRSWSGGIRQRSLTDTNGVPPASSVTVTTTDSPGPIGGDRLGSARAGQVRLDRLAGLRSLEHPNAGAGHGRGVGVGVREGLLDRHDLPAVGLDDLGRPRTRRDIWQHEHEPDQQHRDEGSQELAPGRGELHERSVSHRDLLRQGLDNNRTLGYDVDVQVQTILDAFDQAGYRLTTPRRAVADLITEHDGHFTAAELELAARRRRLALSRATLFRSLDLLTELGVVERLDLPSGDHAYVPCAPAHHHHVVCSRCGRSTDVDDCGVAAAVAEISRRSGYLIETHRLELFGLCRHCQTRITTA